MENHNQIEELKKIADSKRVPNAIMLYGSCILMSHLGRPKGVDQSLSMGNIAKEVERVLSN